MRCKEVRKEISALLDNELSPSADEAVRRHIASCGSCALYYEEMQRVQKLMDRDRVGETVDIADAIMDSICSASCGKKKTVVKRRFFSSMWYRAAALVLFVLLLSVPFILPPAEESSAVESLVEETQSFFDDVGRTLTAAGKGMAAAPETIAFDMKHAWGSVSGTGSFNSISTLFQSSRSSASPRSSAMSGFVNDFLESLPLQKREQ